MPRPAGRPTTFTPEIAAKICEKIAEGKSLRKVCLLKGMPVMSTVFLWLRDQQGFSEQYVHAKEASADADQEMLEDLGDEAIRESKLVNPKAAGAVVSAYKLKADNVKWAMSKKKPKKYGDSLDVSGTISIIGNAVTLKKYGPSKKESESGSE